jgi:hypothetical protein
MLEIGIHDTDPGCLGHAQPGYHRAAQAAGALSGWAMDQPSSAALEEQCATDPMFSALVT